MTPLEQAACSRVEAMKAVLGFPYFLGGLWELKLWYCRRLVIRICRMLVNFGRQKIAFPPPTLMRFHQSLFNYIENYIYYRYNIEDIKKLILNNFIYRKKYYNICEIYTTSLYKYSQQYPSGTKSLDREVQIWTLEHRYLAQFERTTSTLHTYISLCIVIQ